MTESNNHPPARPAAPQKPPPPVQKRGSSILVVFFTLGVCAGIGLLLMVLPLGYIGTAIVVGAIFFSFIVAFHYFVWGWWMSRIVQQESEDES